MMCAILGCTGQVCLLAAVLCGSPATVCPYPEKRKIPCVCWESSPDSPVVSTPYPRHSCFRSSLYHTAQFVTMSLFFFVKKTVKCSVILCD